MEEMANKELQELVRQYHAGMFALETYRMRRAQLLDGLELMHESLEGDTTLPHGMPAIVLKRRRSRGLLALLTLMWVIVVGLTWWSLDIQIKPLSPDRGAVDTLPAQSGEVLVREFVRRGTWGAGEIQDFLTAWFRLPETERRAVELGPVADGVHARVEALRAQGGHEEEIRRLREFVSTLGLPRGTPE